MVSEYLSVSNLLHLKLWRDEIFAWKVDWLYEAYLLIDGVVNKHINMAVVVSIYFGLQVTNCNNFRFWTNNPCSRQWCRRSSSFLIGYANFTLQPVSFYLSKSIRDFCWKYNKLNNNITTGEYLLLLLLTLYSVHFDRWAAGARKFILLLWHKDNRIFFYIRNHAGLIQFAVSNSQSQIETII